MRVLIAIVTVVLLAACAGAPTVTPSPTPAPTPTQSPGPTPTPSPMPTLSPSPSPVPSATAEVGSASAVPVTSPYPTLGPSPSATANILPGSSPTVSGELSPADVRYLLIDQLGPLHYCDPDEYPISHGDEQQKADAQFPLIEADQPTFTAIVDRTGLAGHTTFSETDKLNVYREWKTLVAVDAQPLGSGIYSFDVTTEGDAASGRALHMIGTVDARTRQISITSQEEVFGVSCPICLARGTLIDTPLGPRPVEQLQVGDPIWTVDANGARIASVVARTGSVPVPSTHEVVHVVLSDGRWLLVSPGHPLTDGRRAGDLRAGDALDGATVVSADLVAYDGGRTFDVLPAGTTGFYWANGILLDSTLH
jgi:hypothetical protein